MGILDQGLNSLSINKQDKFISNTLRSIGNDVEIGSQNMQGNLIVRGLNGSGDILIRDPNQTSGGFSVRKHNHIDVKNAYQFFNSADFNYYTITGYYNINENDATFINRPPLGSWLFFSSIQFL